MKGLFIPGITAEMFRNGCLEGIEALMAEGEIYDIEYSKWIPVTERLPENDEKVLCQTVTKKGQINMVIGFYDFERWCCGMNSNVIAWMPLPELYEEGEE